jgi:hypothetical protein
MCVLEETSETFKSFEFVHQLAAHLSPRGIRRKGSQAVARADQYLEFMRNRITPRNRYVWRPGGYTLRLWENWRNQGLTAEIVWNRLPLVGVAEKIPK